MQALTDIWGCQTKGDTVVKDGDQDLVLPCFEEFMSNPG